MITRIPIAILASGRGSNFEAIHSAIQSGTLSADIKLVLSDREDALVLDKAKRAGIRTQVCAPNDDAILECLKAAQVRFVVLAGFMRKIGPRVIQQYITETANGLRYSRIINIHPSLLPAFKGRGGYSQAYAFGAKQAGVTVHLVDEQIDHGAICAQQAFSISDCRSIEEVERRGLMVEHSLYPETLKWILPENFSVFTTGSEMERRLCVRQN